ncbi:Bug family tripartite tricarboxylate transporter substrate binding protein [Bordetella petrii]|uniref:Bug family tripartite tricarboxylate transporter substrate binding protein n=1 Tax=Bordetella petrii TaxID=94624 RepID=UPI001E4BB236|nr:tripartite tricarboxylate transporter substrate binding protein [Bordetella petrii]MCD0502509.1 tripartite tricarboxylate transporter substrate binding protein [Bordetella petrii]
MNTARRMWTALLCGAVGLACATAPALAAPQDAAGYPSRPINLVVPYPAGGGTDTIARLVGKHLGERLGVPVIVENKPGASGIVGNDQVAKAQPDGHTLLLAITALIQTPALYDNIPYDARKDLVPVSEVARSSDLFVVHKDIPADTLQQFVALAKTNPGKYHYGNYGNGTSSHMHGEMFKLMTGTQITAVPFKGAAPLTTSILGGQVASAFVDVSSFNANLTSDRIKILAITGTQRHPQLPDVPTFQEAGMKGFEPNGWFGVFAPAGTPASIVDKLSDQVQEIVRTDEVNGRLRSMGLTPVGNTPEAFAAVIEADMPYWAGIVKDANIVLE